MGIAQGKTVDGRDLMVDNRYQRPSSCRDCDGAVKTRCEDIDWNIALRRVKVRNDMRNKNSTNPILLLEILKYFRKKV